MEALYQKSFQKYLQKAEESPLCISRHRRMPYQIIGTAACLLLIVGMGVGVWTRQQNIEIQPPEQSAVLAATDANTEAHETETALQETQAASTSVSVSTTVQDTSEPLSAVLPTESEEIAETASSAPETVPAPTQPEPMPETAAPVIVPTEPVTPEPTAALTEARTEPTTEETPELSEEQLDGFRVERYSNYRKIICTDAFPAPDGELQPYSLEGDALELVGTSEESAAEPVRNYEICDPETGRTFTVTQQEYAEFALNIEEGELISIGLNRIHGFFLLQEDICSLYWFCDGEGFYVSCSSEDLAVLMEIVRSFTPAEN